MPALKLISLLVAVAVGVLVSVYGVAYAVASRSATVDIAAARVTLGPDGPDASTQIAFWSKRVARQPRAYLDLTLLGQAYARKARETSDVGQYARAEAALRRALRINPKHVPASASLAGVLFAVHDFAGAIATAEPIVTHPHGVQALATLGDANLALGRYRRAQRAYARLHAWAPSPASYTRLAFYADLRGHTEQAQRLLERAATLAQESGDSGESLAWYTFQRGELAFRTGEIELAETRFRKSLDTFPGYPLALGGLAKVRAAQGDLTAAIELYVRLTAVVPQPEYLAALGDLYAAAGDHASARAQYATVGVIAKLAKSNRQVYNRQLANFYSDHDIRVQEALRLARAELRVRKDVYGYDTAAWAAYKNRELTEAQRYVRRALSFGTRDARLSYHAGMVALALGRPADARRLLEEALGLNPHFDPMQAPIAQKALAKVARASGDGR